jgi:ankyrin repeat protein
VNKIDKARFRLATVVAGVFLFLGGCSKTVVNAEKIAPKTPQSGELTVAAYEGDIEKVRSLLAAGAYINENIGTDENQVTPLIAALSNKQTIMAEFLLERGAATHSSYMFFSASDFARYQNQYETAVKIEKSAK